MKRTFISMLLIFAACLGIVRPAQAVTVPYTPAYADNPDPRSPVFGSFTKEVFPWTDSGYGVHFVLTCKLIKNTVYSFVVSDITEEGSMWTKYKSNSIPPTHSIGHDPQKLPNERQAILSIDDGRTYNIPVSTKNGVSSFFQAIPEGVAPGRTIRIEVRQKLNNRNEILTPSVWGDIITEWVPSGTGGSIYGGSMLCTPDPYPAFEYVYGDVPFYASTAVPISQDPNVSFAYRMYNPNTGEHLYTAETNEANSLQPLGWTYEQIGWNAPKSSTKPIYRLYNPYSYEHLYTASLNEYNTLKRHGWQGEGVKFYSAEDTGLPTYRLNNPWSAGPAGHHYTTDAHERTELERRGYEYEGICWYGLK